MAVSEETRAKVMQRFPAFSWLLDIPEIAEVMQRAIGEEWTADTFEANIRATQWWRTQTDTQRARVDMEATNPATAAEQVNALKAQLKAQASSLGGEMSDDRAGALAWAAWRGGWSPEQVRGTIANEVTPGVAAQADVRGLAKAYMVDMDDATAASLTRRVFAGELDQRGVENLLAAQAVSRFPQLADYVKQGIRPADFFAPYRQQIASMIGEPPDSIDLLKSPTWQRVVSHADGGTIRPMTLDEVTKYVRGSNEFASSSNGQKDQASFVQGFARAVGAIGGS